jgi:hypothetical protein
MIPKSAGFWGCMIAAAVCRGGHFFRPEYEVLGGLMWFAVLLACVWDKERAGKSRRSEE